MHEAAHQLLGLIFHADKHESRFRVWYCMKGRTPGEDYWDEWKANTLTSAILMPVKMVRRNMKEFGLGEKIFRLNKAFAPEVYDRFHKMADYMGVSLQALSIRLTGLGLLKVLPSNTRITTKRFFVLRFHSEGRDRPAIFTGQN